MSERAVVSGGTIDVGCARRAVRSVHDQEVDAEYDEQEGDVQCALSSMEMSSASSSGAGTEAGMMASGNKERGGNKEGAQLSSRAQLELIQLRPPEKYTGNPRFPTPIWNDVWRSRYTSKKEVYLPDPVCFRR